VVRNDGVAKAGIYAANNIDWKGSQADNDLAKLGRFEYEIMTLTVYQ
jgi:hypothetical protein